MSAKQYLALSEQDVSRDALAVAPTWLFYPAKGKLEPEPEYKEEAASEWRAQDTTQGNTGDNEERTSTAWKYPFDGRIYPGMELKLLLAYLFGISNAPVALGAPNAAANRYMFSTATDMYGEGTELADKAIALAPNTRKGTSTFSQTWVGGRPKDGELSFKGGVAAELKMNFMGGPWILAPEQTAIPGVSFPAGKAFKSVPKVYLGAGAALTGGAGAYTDFAFGTMPVVKPDDLTIKIVPNIDDEYKMNGFEGPSVTERKKSWLITVEFTVDFLDPASGWSSYDAWVARFAGMTFLPFMMILDSTEIIPSCGTQGYQLGLYVPRMKVMPDPVDRKSDGSKDKIKVKLESRLDPAVNVAAFAKLIC